MGVRIKGVAGGIAVVAKAELAEALTEQPEQGASGRMLHLIFDTPKGKLALILLYGVSAPTSPDAKSIQADLAEINATLVALGRTRGICLAVGSHKANVGYSEASSGLIGCVVALDVLLHSSMAGNAQLRVLNPLLVQAPH